MTFKCQTSPLLRYEVMSAYSLKKYLSLFQVIKDRSPSNNAFEWL